MYPAVPSLGLSPATGCGIGLGGGGGRYPLPSHGKLGGGGGGVLGFFDMVHLTFQATNAITKAIPTTKRTPPTAFRDAVSFA